MNENPEIGLLMPKILYQDDSIQYLPKLLPYPIDLLIRKIGLLKKISSNRIERYEMQRYSIAYNFNTPIISGCCSCFNINALKKVGLYDERFFMYFEDFDLSRRIHEYFKTIYYSEAFVYHGYERGAKKVLSFLKFSYFQLLNILINGVGFLTEVENILIN